MGKIVSSLSRLNMVIKEISTITTRITLLNMKAGGDDGLLPRAAALISSLAYTRNCIAY